MENIVITLPESLWLAIRMGLKQYELRKSWPKIPMFTGRVYVIIKGTSRVAGYFTLENVIQAKDLAGAWRLYGRKLAIEYEWYLDYVQGVKGNLYFWAIHSVYKFDGNIDREEYLGIKHNPQSFVYVRKQPYIPGTLERIKGKRP